MSVVASPPAVRFARFLLDVALRTAYMSCVASDLRVVLASWRVRPQLAGCAWGALSVAMTSMGGAGGHLMIRHKCCNASGCWLLIGGTPHFSVLHISPCGRCGHQARRMLCMKGVPHNPISTS